MCTLPTYAQLGAELAYDPLTGEFQRLNGSRRHAAGSNPTTIHSIHGYKQIHVCGRTIYAHRVAWVLMTGAYPTAHVDHINNDRTDTRWVNLRAATPLQNSWNMRVTSKNKAGIKGVYYERDRKKWAAQICVNKRRIALGRFDSAEEASSAYRAAAVRHFGEYAHV